MNNQSEIVIFEYASTRISSLKKVVYQIKSFWLTVTVYIVVILKESRQLNG